MSLCKNLLLDAQNRTKLKIKRSMIVKFQHHNQRTVISHYSE